MAPPAGAFARSFDAAPDGVFHIQLHGKSYLRIDDLPRHVTLSPGDFVIVFHGRGHQIQDDLRVAPPRIWDVIAANDSDLMASNASWAILGGTFHSADSAALRVLSSLPPFLHVPHEHNRPLLWTDKLLPILAYESANPAPGSRAVVQRIMSLLLVLAVRRHISMMPPSQRDALGAFLDPEIGPALAVIHARLDHPWTVRTLAQEALMSRSSFASKFTARLGIPPLEYLTLRRMEQAKVLLADHRHLLKQIARSVGYLSESAFSSAFRRLEGVSPGDYRHRAARSSAPPPSPPP
jgi:AraC-like DNA-binding protein